MNSSTLSRADGKGKTKTGPPPSSLITFSLNDEVEVAGRHKRTKFNTERRLQVKSVRKRGACMRCRLLKIPCSDDQCCMTCLRVAKASHAHEKQILSFVGCVRTSLSDVNVFAHAFQKASDQYVDIHLSSRDLLLKFQIEHHTMSLGFSYQLQIPAMSIQDFKLLYNTAIPFGKVTKLVLLDFNRFNFPSVLCFAGLFLATMYYRIGPYPFFTARVSEGACIKLRSLGEKCLRTLDAMLKPSHLSRLGKADLEVLIALILGTIYSVVGVKPALELPTFPKESLANPEIPRTLFVVMQEHICNMLAHYMYFIGSKLGVPNRAGWKNLENLVEMQKACAQVTIRDSRERLIFASFA